MPKFNLKWHLVRDVIPPLYLPVLVKDDKGKRWVAYRGGPLNQRTRFFTTHWDRELPHEVIQWISFEELGDEESSA